MADLRKCPFCTRPLGTGDGRRASEEHILGHSRLKKLGLEDFLIANTLHRPNLGIKTKLSPKRAARYVSKGVCNRCNSGWMSELESEVDSVLCGLATSACSLASLSEREREGLAWWTLKTTCTSAYKNTGTELSVNPVPPSHFAAAQNRTRWPTGAQVFAFQSEQIGNAAGVASLNQWHNRVAPSDDPDHIKNWLYPCYKFAFQLSHIVLCLAYFAIPDFDIVYLDGVHVPLFPRSSARLRRSNRWFPVGGDGDQMNLNIVMSTLRAAHWSIENVDLEVPRAPFPVMF